MTIDFIRMTYTLYLRTFITRFREGRNKKYCLIYFCFFTAKTFHINQNNGSKNGSMEEEASLIFYAKFISDIFYLFLIQTACC